MVMIMPPLDRIIIGLPVIPAGMVAGFGLAEAGVGVAVMDMVAGAGEVTMVGVAVITVGKVTMAGEAATTVEKVFTVAVDFMGEAVSMPVVVSMAGEVFTVVVVDTVEQDASLRDPGWQGGAVPGSGLRNC
jgi:hypothetical protein